MEKSRQSKKKFFAQLGITKLQKAEETAKPHDFIFGSSDQQRRTGIECESARCLGRKGRLNDRIGDLTKRKVIAQSSRDIGLCFDKRLLTKAEIK